MIEVTRETPLEACRRLSKTYNNVACFFLSTACGPSDNSNDWSFENGFLSCSSIYACLCKATLFYDTNHTFFNEGYYSNYHILAPKTPVFREDSNLGFLSEPFFVTFVQTAAPTKSTIPQEGKEQNPCRLDEVLLERFDMTCQILMKRNLRTLVVSCEHESFVYLPFIHHIQNKYKCMYKHIVFACGDNIKLFAELENNLLIKNCGPIQIKRREVARPPYDFTHHHDEVVEPCHCTIA